MHFLQGEEMSNGLKSFCRMHGEDIMNYLASHPHVPKPAAIILANCMHQLQSLYLEDFPQALPVDDPGPEEAASE